mmetsp:Transcript_175145/g.561699  ORF Transcript_175145/g.561699 Transcript_175145/m.561699 type:complete len:433 (-) Transcript_175145:76-1374(-)
MGGSSSVHDTYHLQKVKLGEGSFGVVWRAVHKRSGEAVAIKQLDKKVLPRRGVKRSDVDREMRIMSAMRHENIIKLFETFEDQDYIYMALEYCEGGDFGDKLLERGLDMHEPEVAFWLQQMLSAIAYMHTLQICHRDIKPDNFLVAESSRLKLADLGLAVECPAGRLLAEKCGTPAFMAPEQHALPSGSRGYGLLVDVWAAGICMYMLMFGGRHPFMNARGQMDLSSMMTGKMDWKVGNGFLGALGLGGCRMSDEARQLCQEMVTVDPGRRIGAERAAARVAASGHGSGSPSSGDGPAAQGGREQTASPNPAEVTMAVGPVPSGPKKWIEKMKSSVPMLSLPMRKKKEVIPACGAFWEFSVQTGFQAYQHECHDILEEQYRAFCAGSGPAVGTAVSLGRNIEVDFTSMQQCVRGSTGRTRTVRRREARRPGG